MTVPAKPPAPSNMAVSRLKDKLLPSWARSADSVKTESETQAGTKASSGLPAVSPPRPLGFPSRIAEFLLVFRLRANRWSASDMVERAMRMVLVTCKNWFSASDSEHHPAPARKPE
jgi:hypothetical protein